MILFFEVIGKEAENIQIRELPDNPMFAFASIKAEIDRYLTSKKNNRKLNIAPLIKGVIKWGGHLLLDTEAKRVFDDLFPPAT